MAKYEEYERKTEELLLPIMEEYSFELVDVEFVKEAATATCAPILINRAESQSMTVRQSAGD